MIREGPFKGLEGGPMRFVRSSMKVKVAHRAAEKGRGWALVCLLCVIGLLLLPWSCSKGGKAKERYITRPVEKGQIQATVTASGTLNPVNTVKVGSRVSGTIEELHADFNSRVNRGQVIARLDPSLYETQMKQARAQLLMAEAQLQERSAEIESARAKVAEAQAGLKQAFYARQEAKDAIEAAEAQFEAAKANLSSARATLKQAEAHYGRLSNLFKKGLVAKADYDMALAKRDNARAAVEAGMAQMDNSRAQLEKAKRREEAAQENIQQLEARLKGAKANLDRAMSMFEQGKALVAQREAALEQARVNLGYCTIRSPIDGVVISRHVDVGQTVAATLQSPILFTIAQDLRDMQVDVDVNEADVGRVNAGQVVKFTVDAYPGERFTGRVRQVRFEPRNIQNVVTYDVVVDVKNEDLRLRPGMTANVSIVVARKDDVLKVPNAALRFRPPGEEAERGRQGPGGSVRGSEAFKRLVERLNLDEGQQDKLEEIFKEARRKLQAASMESASREERKEALRSVVSQILQQVRKILREDQMGAFRETVEALKALRRGSNARRAVIYVLGHEGRPRRIPVWVGISNDSYTEIVRGDVKEGDLVIVGYGTPFRGRASNAQVGGPLGTILRRGKR